jgi:hypothetical protein
MTSSSIQVPRTSPNTTTPIRSCDEIRHQALIRIEELCRYLLPNGRKEGHRWVAGSIDGAPGHSFDVNLQTGLFGDWADGEKMHQGGIDLWMSVRKVDLKSTLQELSSWLNIPINNLTGQRSCTEPRTASEPHRQILLPKLDTPTEKDLRILSYKRSIDIIALKIAVERGFLYCFDDVQNGRCWLYSDSRRKCGIRRRLDGKPFRLKNGTLH